jgi:hypothetical protein
MDRLYNNSGSKAGGRCFFRFGNRRSDRIKTRNMGTVANLKNVIAGLGAQNDKTGGQVSFYSSGVKDDKDRENKLRGLVGYR